MFRIMLLACMGGFTVLVLLLLRYVLRLLADGQPTSGEVVIAMSLWLALIIGFVAFWCHVAIMVDGDRKDR